MRCFLALFILLNVISSCAQDSNDHNKELMEVKQASSTNLIVNSDAIFKDRWDQLPQPQFWKIIMRMSPDSILVNTASSRKILYKVAAKDWYSITEAKKEYIKDSIKLANGINREEKLNFTTGKNDFYKFNEVYPSISKGVEAFYSNGVDPWYAQSILLIESPGQLKKSNVGAYGAFQLMPSVARRYGLIVNENKDEREDFYKSAIAASKLIQHSCIPSAKRILNNYKISYSETDLWFRLFVLHVYHAGAGNIEAVMAKLTPQNGGQDLIKKMWQTTAGQFGNSSQNYSQLALAAHLILHDMIYKDCDEIFDCVPK
jgi:hypothetical protein